MLSFCYAYMTVVIERIKHDKYDMTSNMKKICSININAFIWLLAILSCVASCLALITLF